MFLTEKWVEIGDESRLKNTSYWTRSEKIEIFEMTKETLSTKRSLQILICSNWLELQDVLSLLGWIYIHLLTNLPLSPVLAISKAQLQSVSERKMWLKPNFYATTNAKHFPHSSILRITYFQCLTKEAIVFPKFGK